jgi:hypothetical protein
MNTTYFYGPMDAATRKYFLSLAKKNNWKGPPLGTLDREDHYHKSYPYLSFQVHQSGVRHINGHDPRYDTSNKKRLGYFDAHTLISNGTLHNLEKEEKMPQPKQYKVDPGSQAMLDVLLDSAGERGWSISSRFQYAAYQYLCVRVKGKSTFGCSDEYSLRSDYKTVDIPTMARILMEEHNKVKMDFQLDSNDVVVYQDKIEVGCLTVSREKIEKIWKSMNDLLDK